MPCEVAYRAAIDRSTCTHRFDSLFRIEFGAHQDYAARLMR